MDMFWLVHQEMYSTPLLPFLCITQLEKVGKAEADHDGQGTGKSKWEDASQDEGRTLTE
jgi:hypothetical protein